MILIYNILVPTLCSKKIQGHVLEIFLVRYFYCRTREIIIYASECPYLRQNKPFNFITYKFFSTIITKVQTNI